MARSLKFTFQTRPAVLAGLFLFDLCIKLSYGPLLTNLKGNFPMMLLTGYKSKKELKENIGKPLRYRETSIFGPEYDPNGTFTAAHRPAITKLPGREFFATVTMSDGLIKKII